MSPDPSALLRDPMVLTAWLAFVPAAVFWLSGLPSLRELFRVTPPVLYVYFLPTCATTLGLTPSTSPTYDWLVRYTLPFALVLLMVTVDLRALARLGTTAILMLLVGTAGIVVGGPVALLLFRDVLPPDAWMGFAALAGSWIGGPTTMLAAAGGVSTPPSALGPAIIVDAVVGYGWMAVLLFLSGRQAAYDRRHRARTEGLHAANRAMAAPDLTRRPLEVRDAALLLGVGLAAAVTSVEVGARIPEIGTPTIVSHTTWTVLLVVSGALLLTLTPARRLEEAGASRLGYATLYLLLAALGSQADLRSILDAPLYLAVGAVWMAIHVLLLSLATRFLRVPFFFFATGSMANVGGVVSAPIVAGVYQPALAPVGLLMAVLGNVVGIYAAVACAYLLALVAP